MLHIGLTGGIGAGKSTVAAELAALGAAVVDADAAARAALAPGTDGLAAVVEQFGDQLLADGVLDRAALGRLVFADVGARRRLEAIVHPLVRAATHAQVAELPRDAVVVHDVPLIVENHLAPEFHLVVVVGASVDERVRRLVRERGMTRDEARARISAQADDEARRAVADVWVDNERPRDLVRADLATLWSRRLAPYAHNLAARRVADREPPVLVEPPRGPDAWSVQAQRLLARLQRAAGPLDVTLDHVGSTSVPGLPAEDVLDLQLGVPSLADADALAEALADAGFPRLDGEWVDTPRPAQPDLAAWAERLHGNADPGRPVNLHLREIGGPGWRYALAFRDWLRSDPRARDDYLVAKREAVGHGAGYAAAKEPWFAAAWPRLEAWVEATGWAAGS